MSIVMSEPDLPRRPLQLTMLAGWIAQQCAERGEPLGHFARAEIRSLCAELMRLNGIGLQPQHGSHHATLTLDGHDVLVEYDYTPDEPPRTSGPPEDCHEGSYEELTFLNVWVNGAWIDANKFNEQQLEEWEGELRQQMEAAREADMEDRAEREYA